MKPETAPITVFINDRPRRAFIGMRVRAILRAHQTAAIRAQRAQMRDADGNVVDMDGALFNGARLYVVVTTPREIAEEVLRRAKQ